MSPTTEFIYWIGRMMKSFGLEESIGAIWGFILLKGEPVTQKEIVKGTGYSISLVSISLNKLEKLGFITNIGRKNRCKLYRASKSFLDGLESYLKRLVDIEINNAVVHLSKELEKIKDKDIRANAEKIISDYMELRIFLNKLIQVLNERKNLNKIS